MKKPLRLTLILAAVCLLLVAGGWFIRSKVDFSIWPPELKQEQILARQTLLSRSYNLFKLNTAEGVYKAVFPHDFIPDGINWQKLKTREQNGSLLTYQEQEWLKLGDFCREKGLWPNSRNPRFIVITVILRVGVEGIGSEGGQDYKKDFEKIFSPDWDSRVLTVHLPKVSITETIIEDPNEMNYPYPDVALTPIEWRKISEYVSHEVSQNRDHSQLIRKGEENLFKLFESFLSDTWWENIQYIH